MSDHHKKWHQMAKEMGRGKTLNPTPEKVQTACDQVEIFSSTNGLDLITETDAKGSQAREGFLAKDAKAIVLTAPDERRCEICTPKEGLIVSIEDEELHPPWHPACRCTLGIHIEGKKP